MKMTLERFREIKERLNWMFNLKEGDTELTEEELMKEFYSLQNELLSSDLSDIPFEEWEGISLANEGPLDFSKTHANLDFSILNDLYFDSINLDGCNVRNLQELEIHEDTFDEAFKKAHPEAFPDDSLPEEVKKAFYEQKLQLTDLIRYPSLKKCVGSKSFSKRYTSVSRQLVELLGIDNILRLVEEYPDMIELATHEEDPFPHNNIRVIKDESLGEHPTYEQAKNYLFERVMDAFRSRYGISMLKGFSLSDGFVDVITPEFKAMFPKSFPPEGVLDNEIEENYYLGDLPIDAIRRCYDTLKDYDLELGTKNSSSVMHILKLFGSIEEYLKVVPDYLDDAFMFYFNNVYDDEDEIEDIYNTQGSNGLFKHILRTCLSKSNFNYYLDDVVGFSKIIPLEELIKDSKTLEFVKKAGLENLIRFNDENHLILEKKSGFGYGYDPFEDSLLFLVANNCDINQVRPDNIREVLLDVVYKLKCESNYDLRNMLDKDYYRDSFIKTLPELFILKDEIRTYLSNLSDEELDNVINNIEEGLTAAISRLYPVLKQYPEIIPFLSTKRMYVNNNYPHLKRIFAALDQEKFLQFIARLGTSDKALGMLDENQFKEFINILQAEVDVDKAFNDAMYFLISNTKKRALDIRELPDSFRQAHPELYLKEGAPAGLEQVFYGNKNFGYYNGLDLLDISVFQSHPDWIPYLKDVNFLLCLESLEVRAYIDGETKNINLVDLLLRLMSKDETIEFLSQYGVLLQRIGKNHTINLYDGVEDKLGKEYLLSRLLVVITNGIKNGTKYDDTLLPEDYKNVHPEFFISKDVPKELYNLFYAKTLTPEIMYEHPEWKQYLLNVDFSLAFTGYPKQFIDTIRQRLGNEMTLDILSKYGLYIVRYSLNIPANYKSMDEIDKYFRMLIIESIKSLRCFVYDERLKEVIGDDEELFLSDDAPEELKDFFYNRNDCYLDFNDFKEHKDWLPFVKGKFVLGAICRGCADNNKQAINGFKKFFDEYGEDALKVGMKNQSAVIDMILHNNLDTLFTWYERLRFIPHSLVMETLPLDYIDRFKASGKMWSQLMRLEEFNNSEENILSLIKSSVAFGVFDGDKLGFNKLMQLFSGIPRTISEADMEKAREYATLNEEASVVTLLNKAYAPSEDGKYVLILEDQNDKATISTLRRVFIHSVSTIMTADKAHKLFGGFKLDYDPSFRDFLLEHYEELMQDDDYISLASQMQRQWKDIKRTYANRVLTLSLAISYVKSVSYEGEEYGNSVMSNEVKKEGYSQEQFEILQQIYNYGKLRTFSSIPRVDFSKDGYKCEIVRLDSPIPLVIGLRSNCCQRLGDAAETAMEHSMTSKHGRLFVITDDEGVVAQSWVWRNKNVICFDNIEVPSKAFTRANKKGISNDQLAEIVFKLYQEAALRLIEEDEKKYKELLDKGLITEEQYEVLRAQKVTVGLGYNDIAQAIGRNSSRDKSVLAHPPKTGSPVLHDEDLYDNDSNQQHILAGSEEVPKTEEETLTPYEEEFEVLDDSTMTNIKLLQLNKLELATDQENFQGTTQVNRKDNFVTEIAWNYGLRPDLTKILLSPNFAIVFAEKEDEIVIADLFYNMKVNVKEDIDAVAKIIIKIRLALEQIKNGKKFNTSMLDEEQLKIFMLATNLREELDEERGLSHEKK